MGEVKGVTTNGVPIGPTVPVTGVTGKEGTGDDGDGDGDDDGEGDGVEGSVSVAGSG